MSIISKQGIVQYENSTPSKDGTKRKVVYGGLIKKSLTETKITPSLFNLIID